MGNEPNDKPAIDELNEDELESVAGGVSNAMDLDGIKSGARVKVKFPSLTSTEE